MTHNLFHFNALNADTWKRYHLDFMAGSQWMLPYIIKPNWFNDVSYRSVTRRLIFLCYSIGHERQYYFVSKTNYTDVIPLKTHRSLYYRPTLIFTTSKTNRLHNNQNYIFSRYFKLLALTCFRNASTSTKFTWHPFQHANRCVRKYGIGKLSLPGGRWQGRSMTY